MLFSSAVSLRPLKMTRGVSWCSAQRWFSAAASVVTNRRAERPSLWKPPTQPRLSNRCRSRERLPGRPPYSRGYGSCQGRDGFQMGGVVRLRATGFIEGRHCQYPLARIESLPAAQPVPADEVNRLFSTTRPDVPFYVGAARSQVGSCAMNVAFGLARPLDVGQRPAFARCVCGTSAGKYTAGGAVPLSMARCRRDRLPALRGRLCRQGCGGEVIRP